MKSSGLKKRMAVMLILLAGGHMTARPGVIITGILDGTLAGGCPKVVELFVTGTENLSNYEVWRSLNGAPFGSGSGAIASMSGTFTNTFVYLVKTDHVGSFHDVFGNEGIFSHVVPMGIINCNGNDGFQVRLKVGSVIIDQVWYENAANSYEDSYWYRRHGTGPDGGWLPSAWETPGNDALDGLDENGLQAQVPFGTFAVAWQGLTTDWNTDGNWSPATVPSFETNVVIPDTIGSFPVIDNLPENPATCMNLTILDTARLIINAGKALTVHGNLWITSLPGDQQSGLIMNADITPGYTGSLMLLQNSLGPVTMKRFFEKDNSWHYLSSPVTDQFIQPVFVPEPLDNSYDFYCWNENSDLSGAWINSRDISGSWNPGFENAFFPGKGYLVSYSAGNSGDPIRSFHGHPVTGNAYISLEHSGNYWNLLGNPYTCSMDWSSEGINKECIAGNAMYIWDPALNENQGGYRTHNGAIGVPEGTGSIIPALQGFFVQSIEAGTLTVDLSLDLPLVHAGQEFYKGAQENPVAGVRLKINRGTLSDETLICMNEAASNGYDPRYDAEKLFNGHTGSPEIYTEGDQDHWLCINSIASIPASIPVGISYLGGDTLNLSFSDFSGLEHGTGIFLEDKLLNTWTDLHKQTDLQFTNDEVQNPRFVLHFLNSAGYENSGVPSELKLWASGHSIFTVNPYERPGTLQLYTLDGKCLQSYSVQAGESLHDVQLPAGLYIARFIAGQAIIAKKVFIY